MPLFEMSANTEEPEARIHKRTLDGFVKQQSAGPDILRPLPPLKHSHDDSCDKENHYSSPKVPSSTPAQGSPALTASGSSPLEGDSPCPTQTQALSPSRLSSTPAAAIPTIQSSAMSSAGEPPAKKRKRLTEDEKKAKADADAAKKQEKEAQKVARAAEQAKVEEEKKRKQEDRDKKKREKEESEKVKAEEKAAKAAERAEKQAEKRQKAEEKESKKREKVEEEAKKDRNQMRLTSMFQKKSTPKKEPAIKIEDYEQTSAGLDSVNTASQTRELTWYEREFRPFFVKENVKLANNRFLMDEETSRAKTQIIDEYISGKREHPCRAFDPVDSLGLPFKQARRGRLYPSVRDIMTKYSGSSGDPLDLTARNAQILDARQALRAVPLKSLKFREDVRPPYIGTVSGLPPGAVSLRKISRNPKSRGVLLLDYDYDSEAEWQDDDGEDLDNDEDEDEDMEDEEEMEDFLDDSEDAGLSRPQFLGGMEPKSYGPCWENYKSLGPEPHMLKYRMEFCLESLPQQHGIDPFSTAYWEPVSKAASSAAVNTETAVPAKKPDAPPATCKSSTAQSGTMAPPARVDAFQALTAVPAAKKIAAGLPPDKLEQLKDLVRQYPKLSKTGVIELFKSQTGCPRAQIVVSFDAITEKVTGKIRKVKGDE